MSIKRQVHVAYPAIPGVQFRAVPNYRSGNRTYVVSSDGRVWIGRGAVWSVVTPYLGAMGTPTVWLNFGASPGGGRAELVSELLSAAFGEARPSGAA